ncbi:MAG: hypothetical protein SPL47_02475, partial [Bacteroidales bacterium]|nr:hypothetical protein [Bacteroidales bacterium]
MKKLVLPLLFLLPVCVFSQSHSWDGNGLASNARLRCLNIFVNIIYDVHPECNDRFQNEQYWPPVSDPALEGINNAAIPTYLLDWMDTVYVPGQLHGSCTRLYGESSFDSLQITGDFIVVNLKESTVLGHGVFRDYNIKSVAMEMISANAALTLFGQKRADDFNATNVLIRNITRAYGGINPGSGSGGRNTLQCVGDGNFAENPTNIVTHEISHGLFGYNNFHTSGGNHRYPDGTVMSFLNIQGGYGLMGAANSGLVGCNGYERWRMHWKHPEAAGYIAARNASNTMSVVSDVSIEDGNRSFLLRDFMTYGDAVRIRLPYKDSETSSNQYIWLENHKVGSNNKLDFLQYSNTAACRPQGAAGVYAYYQIGRDVLEGTSLQVWDNYHRDNLRIISAEGFHDYTKETDTYNLQCVAYDNQSYTLRRGAANPFGGYNDQEMQIVPANEDTVLYVAKEFAPWRIVVEGENRDDLPFLGDNHDAFTSYTRLNMGTNPSTCNTRTFHSNNASYSSFISARQPQLNTRTTYLSGLSIELVPVAGTGDFIVNVSWDDHEVAGAVRWTGDVALKDTAVLVQGSAVTLAQNMTVAQDRRDPETGLFAGRTRFTVESGAYLRQDSASTLSLTESSSMIVDAGAKYELSLGATLHVGAGCMVAFSPDAVVTLKGTVEVDSGGVLTVYDTVGLGRAARLIIRPGGKLIVDGGTLTSACASEMWQGIEVVGNPTKRQEAKYQGYVDLKNGAVVENALCAIYTGIQGDNGANSGGIVKAVNTTFRNNARGVNILPYAYILPGGGVRGNIANFSYCNFIIDNDNNFSQNNTCFTEHVRLNDVSSVEFYSCSFSNELLYDFAKTYRAIYAEDAGFIISKGCPDGLVFEDCVCPESFTPCNTFTGFNRAIEANTTGNQYEIRIDQSKFWRNGTGIRINGNNFVTVTRDSFDLTQGYGSRLGNRTGLFLNNCTGYKV